MNKDTIIKLRNRKPHTIIVYGDYPCRMVFQINKKANCVCWERWQLPINGDRSHAVKLNCILSLRDVCNIIESNIIESNNNLL